MTVARRAVGLIALLLLIEAFDEVVFGVREASWPLMSRDLALGYAEIGILMSAPALVAAFFEPALGLLADSGWRRRLIVAGGVAFIVGLALTATASRFAWLLLGFIVLWPASGTFVSLLQAALMDLDRDRQEMNMARWTLAGSIGAVAGPILLAVAIALGSSWRIFFLGLAAFAAPLALASVKAPVSAPAHPSFRAAFRGLLEALTTWKVVRWLLLLEVTNLMGDVLLGFLALYFVNVVGLHPIVGAAVVVVWTVAGLGGDALLVAILARVSGLRYLRISAVLALVAYPAFLLAPSAGIKIGLLALLGLAKAGWYAIPQGRLFGELGERSGTAVAMSSLSSAVGSLLPLSLGVLAERFGLGAALWVCIAAPITLLLFAFSIRSASAVET